MDQFFRLLAITFYYNAIPPGALFILPKHTANSLLAAPQDQCSAYVFNRHQGAYINLNKAEILLVVLHKTFLMSLASDLIFQIEPILNQICATLIRFKPQTLEAALLINVFKFRWVL